MSKDFASTHQEIKNNLQHMEKQQPRGAAAPQGRRRRRRRCYSMANRWILLAMLHGYLLKSGNSTKFQRAQIS